MGNKWSAKRHNTTAAKESKDKVETGWNDNKTSTSLSPAAAANSLSCSVSQPQTETPISDERDNQLTNGITIYRSYSNMAQPEAEVESRPSSAGVRFDLLSLCEEQGVSYTPRGLITQLSYNAPGFLS